jgi:1-phosphatidylinositol-4-phosphate 5-kinase
MPPQADLQQGDCCRHGQPARWHAGGGGGDPLPFYVPLRKRLSVDGNAKPAGPRICIWECDGEAGDITCDIVAAPFRRSCSARPTHPPAPAPFFRMMTPPPPRPPQRAAEEEEASKPGKAIRRGHRSYSLMLNLQLGIRQINAPSARLQLFLLLALLHQLLCLIVGLVL